MGRMRHHAIIVTSWDRDCLDEARAKAQGLFRYCSAITGSGMNGNMSFLVPPDGSKEGWAESDVGDAARKGFVAWMNEQRYEDESTPLDWVEVEFGGDGGEAVIVNDCETDPA